jgi:hypothetical protein
MAGTVLTIGTDQLMTQRVGGIQISLTDFDDPGVASEIAAGSWIELAGAIIQFRANESMGTNWAAMAAGVVWVRISGSAQTSAYTETAPTWNDELQGWYDATGEYRYYARLYKTAGDDYTEKTLYTNIRQVMHTIDGVALDADGDGDRSVRFASDASLSWDETNDKFVSLKSIDQPAFYATDSGILVVEQSGVGSTDFYIKKCITAYFTAIIAGNDCYFYIYQNGDWREHTHFTATVQYGFFLGPGKYRMTGSGAFGPDIKLYCTGVYDRPTIDAAEIIEEI